mmetsp:Transcript_58128/g.124877  ORF Transcript_58128/g.124877 Transcript_58128/m.124877 type:complete len:217 (+) Transcript_58128:51-701(+)
MRSFVLFASAVALVDASCSSGHTCCCQWDLFIPVMCACVEDEHPSSFLGRGKNNCARADRSKVPFWTRLETSEWRSKGVCSSTTPVISVAKLEEDEKKEAAFQKGYDEFCGVQNKAHCSASEECYYQKTHLSGNGRKSWSGLVEDEVACKCRFPEAREHADGSGECVVCKPAPHATDKTDYLQYVQNAGDRPGAGQFFRNGDLACAFGRNTTDAAA